MSLDHLADTFARMSHGGHHWTHVTHHPFRTALDRRAGDALDRYRAADPYATPWEQYEALCKTTCRLLRRINRFCEQSVAGTFAAN